jgi:hypothetical protein
MDRRLDLHALFKSLLKSEEVYFQPPSDVQMNYPCIVYQRDDAKVEYADNVGYSGVFRYVVTVIDRRPDNPVINQILMLPRCSYSRFYVADHLNHDVFHLFH